MNKDQTYMAKAVELARKGMRNNKGGPFGCIVVRNDQIVGRGQNLVTSANDPTAHAEVVAIRDACRTLGTFQLTNCDLYATCEPCPMCIGAIYWARPRKIIYSGTRSDAANAGFDDQFIYEELDRPPESRDIPMESIPNDDVQDLFEEWISLTDKTRY
ncbi:MAG: nucleoside deaminase [Balneolaceae bacterium]